jgi:hypothetical protein
MNDGAVRRRGSLGWMVGAFLVSSCGPQAQSPSAPPAVSPPVRDARAENYALQEKCAKDASAWYKHWWEDPQRIPNIVSNYTNHYNVRLGQCFLVVSSTMFSKSNKTGTPFSTVSKTLVDVLENRDLGAFDKVSEQARPYQCAVGGTQCTSDDEWDNLAKPYMED